MKPSRLSKVYFSATATTHRCVETAASAINIPSGVTINLADRKPVEIAGFTDADAVIIATPVYGGRIPDLAARKLKAISGNGARAAAMVVYGNRDYDDALLELTDLLTAQGFIVMTAAAFIGEHSIFPEVGAGRPDAADIEKLEEFGKECGKAFEGDTAPVLEIKGNHPYKKYGGVPVRPTGDLKRCVRCGQCVELCPTEAIDAAAPWITDASRCISCGRCIAVCPHSARQYRGMKYSAIGSIFKAAYSKRKEPEIIAPCSLS